MPKVEFTTLQGHKRLIDSRVAAHLAKKGRGQYLTRDLVADTGVPAVVVAPVVTAPAAVVADADAMKPAAAASDSTATDKAAAAAQANADAAPAVLKSNVSTAEAKARREAANKNGKRS